MNMIHLRKNDIYKGTLYVSSFTLYEHINMLIFKYLQNNEMQLCEMVFLNFNYFEVQIYTLHSVYRSTPKWW